MASHRRPLKQGDLGCFGLLWAPVGAFLSRAIGAKSSKMGQHAPQMDTLGLLWGPWASFWLSLAVFGDLWGDFGVPLGGFGRPLGGFWTLLGSFWELLALFGVVFGRFREPKRLT